ncbi:hypothetical protein [Leptospira ilyithenensis]|uniref:Uncharacterized protein n=1 Tax=Leptospira ilyithenensis TaxID=2484901 RepID=A0A4V3JWU0_9LEPT|nr:hypothetical protein [Leptospira ilyithenensis]TGN08288.1 hypothetical protein EHS11_15345 [Leptospira ilyithenensis]
MKNVSVFVFGFFLVIVILFQIALGLGMPWGKLAMGGKFPGIFPFKMRIACIFQILILGIMGTIVFTRAGILFPDWYSYSVKIIWVVVAFFSIGVVLNLITPSEWERIIWAPVTIILLVCSILVATSQS